jgi:tetratricopeptide (TPR) repeat protein
MKLLIRLFTKLYQYSTAIIVVGAPLFFVPKTSFSGDVTYFIAMMLLVAIALFSYVFTAVATKTWHSVSRLEFIAYFSFSFAVIASSIFSKNGMITIFGDAFNPSSGVALLSLPVVMYLVRTLPDGLRKKLKVAILCLLAFSSAVFVGTLIFGGNMLAISRNIFSGFSSSLSFAVYMGLFSIAAFFYTKKAPIKKRYRAIVFVTGALFLAWAVTVSTQDSVRPNLSSTLMVGKKVLLDNGIFGVGAGNFARAWQLHKPQDVINSAYFGYDFVNGDDTITTFLVTIGIVGVIAFIVLVFSALYTAFVSYRQNKEGNEHYVSGMLLVTLVYLFGVSFFVPLSYAMLVLWMSIAGLAAAKAKLTEFHPSKKLMYLFVPLAILFVVNGYVTINKTRAFALYNKAQTATKIEDAEVKLQQASSIYPFDGFYRGLVEYAITSNRNLASVAGQDQEQFKNAYLKKAQYAVDMGLAAVKYNPDNYQNYVTLGRAYELAIPFDKEGGFANAKKSYQEAVKLYPDNPYLYLMLARLETSAGTKEGVREHLTEALRKKQNFADALYLMSQLSASESKMDEALQYAIETVKNVPNDPAAWVQAGLLFYGKKDYNNAVFSLKTALEKDQNNANIAYFLALSLRDGGRPDLAKPLADELLRRNPGNSDIEKFLASLVPQQQTQKETPTTKEKKR